ncbi:alginate export family protein [Croceibacterium ferulae]|uniref:alginate export family protein n=1 Tax=Croceibacterium ferulae TaxID=1854641 RepID=UPI000EB0A759|nr:alginate export family protein [Croceibacterium ferulae]
MRTALVGTLALIAAGECQAQTIVLDPAVELRARYEHVEQDGSPRKADALTVRVRPSLTARIAGWSALVEAEAVVAPIDRYNDGLNGRASYPIVADPENIELNRAQIRYARSAIAATAGRQRIALADERFVGTAPWRQSEQTFDAVRVNPGQPMGLSVDATYSWNVRTVNGRDGFGARPTAIGGDNLFALANYGTKVGTLTGFAYLVDQDEAAVQNQRLSSQTYGVRFAGSAPVGAIKLGYVASWARQRDYRRNPNRYGADYWLGELSASASGFSALGGYEILGADSGVALTSVQAPLSSAFKFNGWTGKFVTTPADGLRDGYATLGYAVPQFGQLGSLALNATWHDFTSDRAHRHYGSEIDMLATLKHGPKLFSIRYAHYEADNFATDTDKFWVQFDLSI